MVPRKPFFLVWFLKCASPYLSLYKQKLMGRQNNPIQERPHHAATQISAEFSVRKDVKICISQDPAGPFVLPKRSSWRWPVAIAVAEAGTVIAAAVTASSTNTLLLVGFISFSNHVLARLSCSSGENSLFPMLTASRLHSTWPVNTLSLQHTCLWFCEGCFFNAVWQRILNAHPNLTWPCGWVSRAAV